MPSLKDKISKNNWPDIVFAAEADREWFDEVTVVTLKSHYYDKVYDFAWNSINNPNQLEDTAKAVMDNGTIVVQEYIKINDEYGVEICLDRDKITDRVVEEALDLLMTVEILPNINIKFGEKKSFLSHEVWQNLDLPITIKDVSTQEGLLI
jgi:hypothetical protein